MKNLINKVTEDKQDQTPSLNQEVSEEEGTHVHNPSQSPAVTGEEEASGSAPSVTSDDDVGKMVEETLGEEPKQGETITDIINRSEEERHRE